MNKEYDKDGVNAWKKADLSNTIETIMQNEAMYQKQIEFFARLRRKKYLALIKEGFTESQSLFLIEKTPLLS